MIFYKKYTEPTSLSMKKGSFQAKFEVAWEILNSQQTCGECGESKCVNMSYLNSFRNCNLNYVGIFWILSILVFLKILTLLTFSAINSFVILSQYDLMYKELRNYSLLLWLWAAYFARFDAWSLILKVYYFLEKGFVILIFIRWNLSLFCVIFNAGRVHG